MSGDEIVLPARDLGGLFFAAAAAFAAGAARGSVVARRVPRVHGELCVRGGHGRGAGGEGGGGVG